MDIRRLSPAEAKGRRIPFEYDSETHYRVRFEPRRNGWTIDLTMEPRSFSKRGEDALLEPYTGDSEVLAAFVEGSEAGIIQFEHQRWNNSLRVWHIFVHPAFKRRGIGSALMDACKRRAAEAGARRVVLETQSSNFGAVQFYLANGFALVGLDATSYSNEDVARGEVRLEMTWHLA
jgi:ribosomal protein S18 acetylase RimI-like enzyme